MTLKKESELGSPWMMGRVDQIIRGRDGIIRRAIIRYRNASENIQRDTERSVRKLIRLYSADDPDLYEDLGELQRRIDQLQGQLDQPPGAEQQVAAGLRDAPAQGFGVDNLANFDLQEGTDESQSRRTGCLCCCQAHCKVAFHNCWGTRTFQPMMPSMMACKLDTTGLDKVEYREVEEAETEFSDPDNLTALIMSVGLNLD